MGGANADPLAACQQRSDARAAGTIAHLGVELLTRGSGALGIVDSYLVRKRREVASQHCVAMVPQHAYMRVLGFGG